MTAARHRAECHPYMEKILISCWRLAVRIKHGTTKGGNKETKKMRIQVGTCERPGKCANRARSEKKIDVYTRTSIRYRNMSERRN